MDTYTLLSLSSAGLVLACLAALRSVGWRLFWLLPATLLHELAHYFVALLLLRSPGLPSIWPKRATGGGWVAGSVLFSPAPGASALIAMAPFYMLVPLAVWLALAPSSGPMPALVSGVTAGFALKGCIPSWQDCLIALKDPLGLGILGAVGLGCWHAAAARFG